MLDSNTLTGFQQTTEQDVLLLPELMGSKASCSTSIWW